MTRSISIALLLLTGCKSMPSYDATVELTIEGVAANYITKKAEIDQQVEGGRYSMYLLPEDPDASAPYVCLRTFAGNPVAHLWAWYRKSDGEADRLNKYECFVPGTLRDGRATLGWNNDDGKPRDKTETGEEGCIAEISREGDQLRMVFAGELRRAKAESKKGKKKSGTLAAETGSADTIQVNGSATLQLGSAVTD